MKVSLAAAGVVLSLLSLLSVSSHAATANANFNVTATLESVCRVKTNALGLSFNYTAFGAAVSNVNGGNVVFECTRGLGSAPTVVFDTVGGLAGLAGSSAPGQGATGTGVVNGLAYTMAVSGGVVTAVGTAATSSSGGSADEYTYTLTGGLLGNQAGTFNASPATVVRTLTVSY